MNKYGVLTCMLSVILKCAHVWMLLRNINGRICKKNKKNK